MARIILHVLALTVLSASRLVQGCVPLVAAGAGAAAAAGTVAYVEGDLETTMRLPLTAHGMPLWQR